MPNTKANLSGSKDVVAKRSRLLCSHHKRCSFLFGFSLTVHSCRRVLNLIFRVNYYTFLPIMLILP